MKMKRVVAICLALLLVFSNVPAMVWAENTEVTAESETSEDQSYEDALEAARKAAEEQAAAQQYELDQESYETNEQAWSEVDQEVSPELGAPEAPAAVSNDSEELDSEDVAADTEAEKSAQEKEEKKEEKKDEDRPYPAYKTSRTVAGTGVQVNVDAPKGALPGGVVLSVGLVETPAEVLSAIESNTGASVSQDDTLSIDVHFFLPTNPNEEIEPLVPINVTFSNINMEAETVDVYHETEKIAETSGEGGTLTLDSFSTYTFVANDGVDNNGSTPDGYVTVTIPNQTMVVGAPPISLKDIVKTENANGETFEFNPEVWNEPIISGTSVVLDDLYLNPVAVGKTTITMSRKAIDDYWVANPLTVSFVVNVVEDNSASTPDGVVTVTIPDQNIKLDVDESGTEIAIADITTTVNNETGVSSNFDPTYWTNPVVTGDSVTVDNYVITPVALGESTITMSRTTPTPDPYWDNNPLTITFKVNVTTEVSYQGNGADTGENMLMTYTEGTPGLEDGASNFTKDGYKFIGWAKDPSATTPDFQPGDDILANDIYGSTVYAVWEEITRKPVIIEVNRVWDDDDNRDGLRSRTDYVVTASLPDGTVLYQRTDRSFATNATGTMTVSQGDGGRTEKFYTMTEDGQEITYTITATHRDTTAGDYTVTAVLDNETDDGTNVTKHFTITNTHAPEKYGPISVTKVWDDDNNRDGKRADILVQIKRDGETVRQSSISDGTKAIAESNTDPTKAYYKYHDGGVAYTYTVEERNLPEGYEQVSIEGDVENGFTITNKHDPETVQIKVNKVWDDVDDQDGKRPEEITLHVIGTAGGEEVARRDVTWPKSKTSSTITKDNTLTTPLYKYYNGEEISYEVTEDEVSEYTTAVTGSVADGFTVTNTHEPEMRTLTVTKSWEGEVDGDTSRRSDVNVTIMADGTPINEQLTITGDASETTWTGTIEVPRYHDQGQEYTYTVEENDVPFYRNDGVTGDMDAGFTLHNTYIPNTTTVTINKVWKDAQNADGFRPDVAHVLLMNNGEMVKEARLRAADDWTVTFTGVQVYADPSDPDSIIDYKVEEDNNYGYIVTVVKKGDAIDGYTYTVTNTMPEAGKIDIPVTKVWKDDDNRDGLRPASIDVTLKTGEETVATLTLTEADGWKGTFEGVPAMDIETEEPIEYTLEEITIDGYDAKITGDAASGFTVTNTHKPEVIDSIAVTKVWKDAENQDGIRPETLYVRLFKADGTYAGRQKTVSESNGWATTFDSSQKTPIYKYENGKEIEYTVVESTAKNGDTVPEGYEMEVSGSAAEGFTVTNTHKPETVEINVTKEWVGDNDNADKNRPDALYAVVLADGERVRQRELNEANGWSATITAEKQYKYKPGEEGVEIQYEVVESWERGSTVEEDPLGLYESEVTGDVKNGFTFTNTYQPKTFDLTVFKHWDDEDNLDNSRKEATMHLEYKPFEGISQVYPGSERTISTTTNEYGIVEVAEFEGLPGYIERKEAIYFVHEDVDTIPEGYEVTTETLVGDGDYTAEGGGADWVGINGAEVANMFGGMFPGFELVIITNTHEPEKVDITVNKVWMDEDENDTDGGVDRDGKRPESITYLLLADGEEVARGTATEAEEWKYSFTDMPIYNDGATIAYTVSEEPIDEYYMSVSDPTYTTVADANDTLEYTITNTYDPEKTTITVVKQWDDNNDASGRDRKASP